MLDEKYNYGYTIVIMKTAISIPNSIFEAAERFAQRLGVSRSQLYTTAVSEYLRENRHEQITEKLNEVYAKESSHLDPVLYDLQSSSLNEKDW